MKDSKKNVVGFLTVYVDDCVIACDTPERTAAEMAKIHAKHELEPIKYDKDLFKTTGTIKFDLCGTDVEYNAEKRYLRMHMTNYVKKILKQFDMDKSKPRSSPSFIEANLYNKSSGPSNFKYRACVGALQWLATTARPDIAHATNMLARAASLPVTNAMAKCCRLVMRYLVHAPELGIEYSPELEEQFTKKYRELTGHAENKGKVKEEIIEEPVHTFTDASFGVTYKELRSISGVVVYLWGCPIAWKSKVQSVFAGSTTEAEWIAMSDGIELANSIHSLTEFFFGDPNAVKKGPLYCDNRGAVVCGRKGHEDTAEIPKKTRHVALRFARVLDEKDRLWFCPTDEQKADGLTKSRNTHALRQIFVHDLPPMSKNFVEDEDDEDDDDDDFTESYWVEFPRGETEPRSIEELEVYWTGRLADKADETQVKV